MKTTIIIPDHLIERAAQLARQMDISRSELYARALARYLEKREAASITRRLKALYETEESEIDVELIALQVASLPGDQW